MIDGVPSPERGRVYVYPGEFDSEKSESWLTLLERELPASNLKEEWKGPDIRPVGRPVERLLEGRQEVEEE